MDLMMKERVGDYYSAAYRTEDPYHSNLLAIFGNRNRRNQPFASAT
jgi:hypothetical protein